MIESAAHGNNEHTNHFHSVPEKESRLHQPSVSRVRTNQRAKLVKLVKFSAVSLLAQFNISSKECINLASHAIMDKE